MYLTETLWNAMGWCPVAAASRCPGTENTGSRQTGGAAGNSSTTARRSAQFMRMAWGVVVLSWIVAFLALPYLPEVIPIHWGLHGEPNGFADRFTGIMGLPVIITLFMALLLILPRFDSIQPSLLKIRDSYAILVLATLMIPLIIELIVIAVAVGVQIPVVAVFSMLIGFIFIVMGGLMPQIGRNSTMGIRLPWTLASDEVWKKTHEHCGPVFTGTGILIVIGSALAGTWAIVLMLVLLLGSTAYVTIWSYRIAHSSVPGERMRI